MSRGSKLSRRWQCPGCALTNAAMALNCIACFTSRLPSKRQQQSKAIESRKMESKIATNNNTNNNNNNNNNNNHSKYSQGTVKSSQRRPVISSRMLEPMKISETIDNKILCLLSGFIRHQLNDYLYPSELVLIVNLYLTQETFFKCTMHHELQRNKGLKLCTSGELVQGKGMAMVGFNINARNPHLLYEWTVNIRTFNPPVSFIGIVSNDNRNNYASFETFQYAENTFCCGIGGEKHRVFRMGKLNRKIKYKSGWHCNNVSHWNDNMDVVQCRYDGRTRKLSFTKFIQNTNKFKLICTIQIPHNLPSAIDSWYPAIYMGHVSDSAFVNY